jgi:hypothetical protein
MASREIQKLDDRGLPMKLEIFALLIKSWQLDSKIKPAYHFGSKFQGYYQEKLLMGERLHAELDTWPTNTMFFKKIKVNLPDGTAVYVTKFGQSV